jgi:hypothetical protein
MLYDITNCMKKRDGDRRLYGYIIEHVARILV